MDVVVGQIIFDIPESSHGLIEVCKACKLYETDELYISFSPVFKDVNFVVDKTTDIGGKITKYIKTKRSKHDLYMFIKESFVENINSQLLLTLIKRHGDWCYQAGMETVRSDFRSLMGIN